MKLIYFTISTILFITLFSCEKKSDLDQEPQTISIIGDSLITINSRTISIYDIQFSPVMSEDITQSVRAIGNIDVPPSGKAELSTLLGGRITQINVIEGEKVVKGEVLAVLESLNLLKVQENYLTLFYEIPVIRENYARQKQLFQEEISSKKKYLEAKSILELKTAQLNSLKEELNLLDINIQKLEEGIISRRVSIKSPVNGFIENVFATLGHYVEPNEHLFSIIDPEHLHLELNVFSNDVIELKTEQKIVYQIPALSDEEFTGEVFLITSSLDPEDKSLNVHGHINQRDRKHFIPGLLVEGKIITSSISGNLIADEGIASSNNEYYVFEKVGQEGESESVILKPIKIEYHGSTSGLAQFIPSEQIKNEVVSKGAYHLMALWKSK